MLEPEWRREQVNNLLSRNYPITRNLNDGANYYFDTLFNSKVFDGYRRKNEKEKQNDVSREGKFRDKGNGDGGKSSMTGGLSNVRPKNKLTKKKKPKREYQTTKIKNKKKTKKRIKLR